MILNSLDTLMQINNYAYFNSLSENEFVMHFNEAQFKINLRDKYQLMFI